LIFLLALPAYYQYVKRVDRRLIEVRAQPMDKEQA